MTPAGGREPGEPVPVPGEAGSGGTWDPVGSGGSSGGSGGRAGPGGSGGRAGPGGAWGRAGPGGSWGSGGAPSARLALLQLGAVWGAFIGLGVLGGYLLDRVAGTSPLLTFVGLALGILGAAAGSYRVIRPYLTDASSRAAKTKD